MSRAIDALGYYEAKALQMQRASLRGDTKAMLVLMQELAIDGGAIARRAIDSQATPEPSTVAVDAGPFKRPEGVPTVSIGIRQQAGIYNPITGATSVAVDAGALDELRGWAEAYENAWASGVLHEKKIAALRLWHSARRLLAGGE